MQSVIQVFYVFLIVKVACFGMMGTKTGKWCIPRTCRLSWIQAEYLRQSIVHFLNMINLW